MKKSPGKSLIRRSPPKPIRKLASKQQVFSTFQVDFIFTFSSKPQSLSKLLFDYFTQKSNGLNFLFEVEKPTGAIKDVVSGASYSCMVHLLCTSVKQCEQIQSTLPEELVSKDKTKKMMITKKTNICTFPVPCYIEIEKDRLVYNVDLSNQLWGLLDKKAEPLRDWCQSNKTYLLSDTPTPKATDKKWIAYKGCQDVVKSKQVTPSFLKSLQRFTERVVEVGGNSSYEALLKAYGGWSEDKK